MRTNRILSLINEERLEEYRQRRSLNSWLTRQMSYINVLFRKRSKIHPDDAFTDVTDPKASPDPSVHNLRIVRSETDLVSLPYRASSYEQHIFKVYQELYADGFQLPGSIREERNM